MSTNSNLGILLAVIGVGAVGLSILRAKLAGIGGGAAGKFKAKRLLSANELEFIGRLESAAPELRFHAQVSMGAVLDPAVPRSDGKAYMSIRGMFAQKIIDFVAQDKRSGDIVAIIELDDRTHNDAKDAKRDAMLTSAGYRAIRWNSKAKPDAAAIRAALFPPPPVVASPSGIANRIEPSL
jgi:Protein of unknown function (DUF2726)